MQGARVPSIGLAALWLCTASACDGLVDLAAVPALERTNDASLCGASPQLQVNGTPRCAGDFLAETLGAAVCSCEDLAASAPLFVDAFDARDGAYSIGSAGGDLFVDGALNLQAGAELRGAVSVAGSAGSVVGGARSLRVEQLFESAGDLAASGATVQFLDDARVAGQLLADSLQVTGTLQMTDTSLLQVAATSDVNALQMQPVNVATKCQCDSLASSPRAPASDPPPDDSAALEVCGTRRIPELTGDTDITIAGEGVLQIDGDVALGGALHFQVPDAATLYVLVAGNLRVDGGLHGNTERPGARVHLLVAGDGTVQLDTDSALQGSLVAPSAELVSPAELEIFGALLVRRAAVAGPLSVHYDRSLVEEAATACAAP